MKLYAWQQECLEKWIQNCFRGIADVVTGAGKTVLALEGARMLFDAHPQRLRVRIVTPTLALARQWVTAIHEYEKNIRSDPSCASAEDNGTRQETSASVPTPGCETASGVLRPGKQGRRCEIGTYCADRKDSPCNPYTIYVINSARYALARHILEDMTAGYHVFLIADECHRYASDENRKIFDFLGQKSYSEELYHCIGLTATPRSDEGGVFLERALGKAFYHYTFHRAVADRTVTPFFIYQIGLSFLADEMAEYSMLTDRMAALYGNLVSLYPRISELKNQDFFRFLNRAAVNDGEDSPAAAYMHLSFQRAAVCHMAAARAYCVRDLICQLDPDTRILVFCERICQAESLVRLLRDYGIRQVGIYHSHMPEMSRKRTLQDFCDGETRILISCKALDEGLDVPDAVVGIVLSGTSMTRQRIQRTGRLLRRRANKPWACLYYLYVRESAEEGTFLPEYKNSEITCNLSYDMNDHAFLFPDYEEKIALLCQTMQEKGTAHKVLKELRRCLLRGTLRPDWMTSAQELERRIQAETDLKERNYLLCMKQLSDPESSLNHNS